MYHTLKPIAKAHFKTNCKGALAHHRSKGGRHQRFRFDKATRTIAIFEKYSLWLKKESCSGQFITIFIHHN
jgi:hypothetical protein